MRTKCHDISGGLYYEKNVFLIFACFYCDQYLCVHRDIDDSADDDDNKRSDNGHDDKHARADFVPVDHDTDNDGTQPDHCGAVYNSHESND